MRFSHLLSEFRLCHGDCDGCLRVMRSSLYAVGDLLGATGFPMYWILPLEESLLVSSPLAWFQWTVTGGLEAPLPPQGLQLSRRAWMFHRRDPRGGGGGQLWRRLLFMTK